MTCSKKWYAHASLVDAAFSTAPQAKARCTMHDAPHLIGELIPSPLVFGTDIFLARCGFNPFSNHLQGWPQAISLSSPLANSYGFRERKIPGRCLLSYFLGTCVTVRTIRASRMNIRSMDAGSPARRSLLLCLPFFWRFSCPVRMAP